MTTVNRRTFLIGLSALVAAPALRSNPFVGEIATGTLHRALGWRKISDVVFSSMPTAEEIRTIGEEPVRWTAFVDDNPVMGITINLRSTYRWVSVDDASNFVVPEKSIFRMVVEPCHTHTSMCLTSNIEPDPLRRSRCFSECYRWVDVQSVLDSVAALDPRDVSVVA